jgi:ribosomal protein S6
MDKHPDHQRYLLTCLSAKAETLDELVKLLETRQAVIKKSENLGSRSLAFKINKHAELQLMSVFFETQPINLPPIQEELKHAPGVERFLLTTWNADFERPVRKKRELTTPAVAKLI